MTISKTLSVVVNINDRWRITEDGQSQWILQWREGERWRHMAFCGTKDGLIGIAYPIIRFRLLGVF